MLEDALIALCTWYDEQQHFCFDYICPYHCQFKAMSHTMEDWQCCSWFIIVYSESNEAALQPTMSNHRCVP